MVLLFVVFAFVSCITANAERGFDKAEVQEMLQPLMDEISNLKAKYSNVVAELNQLKGENYTNIWKRTQATQSRSSSFYAYSTYNQEMDPGPRRPVLFDHVTTNNGGSFNPGTGQFTCKRRGTYVFSWTSYVLKGDVPTNLMLNGNMAASTGTQFQATNMCVLNLEVGDTVYVRASPRGHDRGAIWSMSSFSGFLLE